MAIRDIYSKRQKRLKGDVPDVYVYNKIPHPLRVQLVQIISHRGSEKEVLKDHMLGASVDQFLDNVELCLQMIDTEVRKGLGLLYKHVVSRPDAAIAEANTRFQEHGVGFEFVAQKMVRIDSQILHAEVVRPALALLAGKQYEGANDEFLKAHEHYRHGRYKECLNECLKSFESTMKSICDANNWPYSPRDTAKTLIETCMGNELFPSFMQNHLANLRAILESGVPTVRNKLGGHGQGTNVTPVTAATARFALHSTASNLLLFIESAQQLPA